jgi:putative flippase GtrA
MIDAAPGPSLNGWRRFARFNAVGAAGIGVQLGALWILTAVAHVHYVPATGVAVALAVVHNFAWHRHWTWADRPCDGIGAAFLRFAAANGLVSLLGSLILTTAFAALAAVPPVAANVAAIAVAGLLNYRVGDTVVFRRR